MISHRTTFDNLYAKSVRHGHEASDTEKTRYFKHSWPRTGDFAFYRATFESLPATSQTWDKLDSLWCQALRSAEESEAMGTHEGVVAMTHGRDQGQEKGARNGGSSQVAGKTWDHNTQPFRGVCYYCQKPGHKVSYCRSLAKDRPRMDDGKEGDAGKDGEGRPKGKAHALIRREETDEVEDEVEIGDVNLGSIYYYTSDIHDFYLQAHAGLQGTARPTHYVVVADENKYTADKLQGLVNTLCYSFARATRSVSMVPVAYYAHIVAEKVRLVIDDEDSDNAAMSSTTSGSKVEQMTFNATRVSKRFEDHPKSNKVAWESLYREGYHWVPKLATRKMKKKTDLSAVPHLSTLSSLCSLPCSTLPLPSTPNSSPRAPNPVNPVQQPAAPSRKGRAFKGLPGSKKSALAKAYSAPVLGGWANMDVDVPEGSEKKEEQEDGFELDWSKDMDFP
ncbi:hypothetical protein L198_07893 [Cryptococcus wingfieldii CBS 7118]|uniref:Piwi domain-containing protein n=1 Tax=Cryptococcus wingfieldii CBS 7118 TaxID=1295528 RepID=A0A1E3HUR8_9TREE|nr:hypothetical protein L198_07893 [Cryptococcus wingfieldii CBS 7118]ODN80083.1 hypothetical protein L198_07893 [Cryptococcus wingfieldii CBS 7118]